MTIPTQRGAQVPDDSTVTQLILDAVREVKDQVVRLESHLTTRLDGLDARYVPRAEYEARHSDVRQQITKTEARIDALEIRLTSSRRFAVTTAIASVAAVIGLISTIFVLVSGGA